MQSGRFIADVKIGSSGTRRSNPKQAAEDGLAEA